MESKDLLKEVLGNIDQMNAPIDLERIILKKIQAEENSKIQIARYKAKGMKAFIASGILILVLAILFSLPGGVRSVEHAIITYTSIILVLLVFFVQLEIGSARIFQKAN